MEEKRKYKRTSLIFFISVFNRSTGKLIGYLGDVTPGGALVLSEESFPLDEEIGLDIETFAEAHEKEFIAVDAKCVRCSKNENFELFNCGFEFTKISHEDKEKIKKINDELKLE